MGILDATLAAYQAAATGEAVTLPLAPSAPVFAEGVMGLRELVAGSSPAAGDGVSADAGLEA